MADRPVIALAARRSQFRMHVACLNGGGVLRGEVVGPGLGEIPEFRLTGF